MKTAGFEPAVFFGGVFLWTGPAGLRHRCARRMVQVQPFFAVPFGFAQLENGARLNADLRAFFLQRASEGAKYANPRPLTQPPRQTNQPRRRRPTVSPATPRWSAAHPHRSDLFP